MGILRVQVNQGGTPTAEDFELRLSQLTEAVHEATYDLQALHLTFRSVLGSPCVERLRAQEARLLAEHAPVLRASGRFPGERILPLRSILEGYAACCRDEAVWEWAEGQTSLLEPGPRSSLLRDLRTPLTGSGLSALAARGADPGWEASGLLLPAAAADLRSLLLAPPPQRDGSRVWTDFGDYLARLVEETIRILGMQRQDNCRFELHPGGLRLQAETLVPCGPAGISLRGFRPRDPVSLKRLELALGIVNAALFEPELPGLQMPEEKVVRDEWNRLLADTFGQAPQALGCKSVLPAGGSCARMSLRKLRNANGGGGGLLLSVHVPIARWPGPIPTELERRILRSTPPVEPFFFSVDREVLLLGMQREEPQRDLKSCLRSMADLIAVAQEVRPTLASAFAGATVPAEDQQREWLLRPDSAAVDLAQSLREWGYTREAAVTEKLLADGDSRAALGHVLGLADAQVRGRLLIDLADHQLRRGCLDEVLPLWDRLEDGLFRGRLLDRVLQHAHGPSGEGLVRSLLHRWIEDQSRTGADPTPGSLVRGILQGVCRQFGDLAVEELLPEEGHPALRAEWISWMAENLSFRLQAERPRWEARVGRMILESSPPAFLGRMDAAIRLHDALEYLGWDVSARAWAEALRPTLQTSEHEGYYLGRLKLSGE